MRVGGLAVRLLKFSMVVHNSRHNLPIYMEYGILGTAAPRGGGGGGGGGVLPPAAPGLLVGGAAPAPPGGAPTPPR
eukprot:SAG31_NODE_167_length_21485_cov_31.094922_1_plen_75_part_10